MAEPPASHPQQILDVLTGYQASAALHAAIELDLFTAVADGRRGVADLAEATQCAPRGIRILADYLVTRGFLTKTADAYGLAPAAATFLSRRSGQYLGGVARFLCEGPVPDLFRHVAASARRGGTADPAGGLVGSTDAWSRFAGAFDSLSRAQAAGVAAWIVERGWPLERVLDLGAGSGAYGIEIAKQSPSTRVHAIDRPEVVATAARHADDAGLAGRWTAIPGDVFTADWGGPYDLVVAAHFLHHFSESKCVDLLRSARASVRVGGGVLVVDAPPDEDRVSPPDAAAFALFLLVASPGGDAWRVSDYARMCRAAGLPEPQVASIDAGPRRLVWTRRT